MVTTGTGSGKSLCFFVPIIDAILKAKEMDAVPRTRAVIVYPMNALANSQAEELQKFPGRLADRPVTYARYTGQETSEERERIRDNPPDILLTNFMMLELLMTRQDALDRKVIANCDRLKFLVLDELHTYRGALGGARMWRCSFGVYGRDLATTTCMYRHLPRRWHLRAHYLDRNRRVCLSGVSTVRLRHSAYECGDGDAGATHVRC